MSPPETPLEKFESSHNKISNISNYVLVTNGILLTAYITGLDKLNFSHTQSTLSLALTPFGPYIAAIFPSANIIPFSEYLLHLSFVFTLMLSIACSIGVFNTGIYFAFGKNPNDCREFTNREKKGISWYRWSTIFLGTAMISLYSLFLSPFLGVGSAFIVWFVSLISFVILIVKFQLLSKY